MEDSLDTCSVSGEENTAHTNNSNSSDNDEIVCSSRRTIIRKNNNTSDPSRNEVGVINNNHKSGHPRKNKRKMSEPRRLSDYGAKRSRPDSPASVEGSLETSGSCCPRRSDGSEDGTTSTPPLDNDEDEEELSSMIMMRTRESRVSSCSDPDLDAIRLPPGVIPVPHGFEFGDMAMAYFSQNQSPDEMGRNGNASPNSFYRCDGDDDDPTGRKPRKNYKSMTMERRIEANARERSRVHTISAAFENLRRAVPSYSYNQKLSKLAILRIACCYILSLSRLAEMDYSRDQSRPSFGECVDLCTRTIQTEGRAKKRH